MNPRDEMAADALADRDDDLGDEMAERDDDDGDPCLNGTCPSCWGNDND